MDSKELTFWENVHKDAKRRAALKWGETHDICCHNGWDKYGASKSDIAGAVEAAVGQMLYVAESIGCSMAKFGYVELNEHGCAGIRLFEDNPSVEQLAEWFARGSTSFDDAIVNAVKWDKVDLRGVPLASQSDVDVGKTLIELNGGLPVPVTEEALERIALKVAASYDAKLFQTIQINQFDIDLSSIKEPKFVDCVIEIGRLLTELNGGPASATPARFAHRVGWVYLRQGLQRFTGKLGSVEIREGKPFNSLTNNGSTRVSHGNKAFFIEGKEIRAASLRSAREKYVNLVQEG